jgi:hypothetical protein
MAKFEKENFIDSIKSELEENYYHIRDTHFKIGAKLHSTDFYYAKPLFQNSQYATGFAEMIVEKIKDKFNIKLTEKTILIGYEMYSELLLSIVRKEMQKKRL